MTDSFDPYHVWLGIPPSAQPPDYYHLLGIQPFESDPAVIDHAADRQMTHVRGFQTGPHSELSQRLLNEIAAARSRLLDPAKKAEYDAELRRLRMPAEPPVVAPSMVVPRAAVPRTRRGHRSPIFEIAKIVLGGLTGLALGALLLRQFAGIDLIGGKQKVPAIAANTGASKSPEDKSTPQRSGSSPSAGESQSSPAAPVAAGEQNEPGKNSDTRREAGNSANGPASPPVGQLTESSATGPAAKSAQSGDLPEVLPAEQPKKHAVPLPERQAAVRAQIDELFKIEDSKQPADKLKLVNELRKVADDTTSSPDERFVLVRRASELAVDGGELAMALELVAHLNREFDFDLLVVKQAAITRFAKSATKEAAIETAVGAEMNLIGAAEHAGRYDVVLDAAEALFDLCQKSAGVKFRKQASDTRDEARQLQADWLAFQNAVTKLEESPEDAEANLTAGRWHCLRLHEWEIGLPLLAKGSDKSLAAAANIDLAETTSADEMLSRADQWYAIGTANAADRGFLARAVRWYNQAKPLATGLARAKADKRLAGIQAAYADFLKTPSLVAGNVDLNQRGQAAIEPKKSVKPRGQGGIPSIEGAWQELPGVVVHIAQKGSDFTATTTYKHANAGTVRWVMEGSISGTGKIEGNLRHVAPKDWKSQKRVGVLAADLNTIKGTAMLDGGGTHEFVWTRLTDRENSGVYERELTRRPAASGGSKTSASTPSAAEAGGALGGHSNWVGLGLHTKGPLFAKEFQRVELQVSTSNAGQFTAEYFWKTYTDHEIARGQYPIVGTLRGDAIEWECKSKGIKTTGWLRDGVIFFSWNYSLDSSLYFGENIYVPASSVEVAPFAGKYTVSGAGQETFQLELRPDGSATKSHLPRGNGAWLGTTDRAWIVWTDGWRDVLIRERGKIQKQAFQPGSSLNDPATNAGTAVKTN